MGLAVDGVWRALRWMYNIREANEHGHGQDTGVIIARARATIDTVKHCGLRIENIFGLGAASTPFSSLYLVTCFFAFPSSFCFSVLLYPCKKKPTLLSTHSPSAVVGDGG